MGIGTPTLHFRLLGPFEVVYDDRRLELGRPKQRAVLAILLVNANRIVSVDRFADVLWPDGTPDQSTASLPVYVAGLRRLLEPDRPARTEPTRIVTRAPGYLIRVAPGEYDVADFERLAADGSLHLVEGRPRAARRALGDALSLWRGPAMEEFAFAQMEATRLLGLRVDATEARIIADLALGAHDTVVAELEQLIREHPLRERLVELLMLALYRSGRTGDALRAFSSARDRLLDELGIDPGPELRRLEADVLAQSSGLDWQPPAAEGAAPTVPADPPAPAAVPEDVFVGREAELAALAKALAPAADATGAVVLVAGEPGIGKTRLVHEAVTGAATRGFGVAWGRCDEGDGAPPFLPWIQVVRALLDHPDADAVHAALTPDAAEIAQLVPEVKELVGDVVAPAPSDPVTARHRLFDAVTGFLTRLSRHQPVVVILDDLHWADLPSLELAGHLFQRLPGSNVSVIVTYRDVDPAPHAALTEVLASLVPRPGRVELPLAGLTQEDVARFVTHEAGGELPADVVAAVWDQTGGNPFFVGELTRLLVAEKKLSALGAAGVPWAVRQVVSRRMARLPKETQRLMTVAAVAGTDFDVRVVGLAANVDLDHALDLVDVAVAAGLLKEQPGTVERFRFSHALVQQTVYEELTRLRRASLHGKIADAMEAMGGDDVPAAEVAHHLHEAVAVAGPVRAIEAAARASTAALAALAYEAAEDHLRRGLELVATMTAGPERDRHELDIQVQLATLLSTVKGLATSESAVAWERATELCRAVEDQHRLLRSLWGLLAFAWARGDMAGARALAEHLLQLGRTSSDPSVIVTARLGLGLVALCCGELVDGSALLAAGKEVVDAVPEDEVVDVTFADLRVQVDSWLSMARHLQGNHEDGRRLVDGAVQRARDTGGYMSMATALTFAVVGRVLSGEIAEAWTLAEELISEADRLQLADFTFHGRVVRAWALARNGTPAGDVRPVVEALPSAVAAGIRPWHPFWLTLVAEAWQRLGEPVAAHRLIQEAQAEIDAMGSSFSVPEVRRLRAELLAVIEPERSAELVADLRDAAAEADAQGAVVSRDRALASAARLEQAVADGVVDATRPT